MKLPDDLREFIELLNSPDVRYLIVGGYAVAFGGYPRTIGDKPGHSATRYVHPTAGRSVVVDDVTNEVVHVGGDGFLSE